MAVRRSGLTRPNLPGMPELRRSLGNIVELLRTWNGEGRDERDRVLTAREFEDAIGFAKRGFYTGLAGTIQQISASIDPITPIAPTGVLASAAFHHVVVEWDNPGYQGHAYAEIWRSDTDDLGTAVMIGMAPGRIYGDSDVTGSQTYYYWVRFVSVTDISGPYNATEGTSATTAPDIDFLLSELTDSITSSELAQALRSRIDLIDTPVTGLVDSLDAEVQARIDEVGALEADIQTEVDLRADEDDKLARQLTLLFVQGGTDAAVTRSVTAPVSPEVGDYWVDTTLADLVLKQWDGGAWVAVEDFDSKSIQASVATEKQARIDGDGANATEITTLKTTVNDPVTGVSANAGAVSTLDTRVGDTEDGITAQAQSIQQLETTVDDPETGVAAHTVTLQEHASVQDGLKAQYTVKIDNNGAVAGFGLASTAVDDDTDGAFSEFYVNAERFAILPQGGAEVDKVAPFTVTGNAVHIDAALIKTAAIQSAQIASLAADKITATTLSAITANMGAITAGSLSINNRFIVSTTGQATIRSAVTGARLELSNDRLMVFDSAGTLRVIIGNLA